LSFAWICGGIAAIVGGVSSAFILQYFSPYYSFFIYGCCGLIFAVVSARIPKRLEEDQSTIDG